MKRALIGALVAFALLGAPSAFASSSLTGTYTAKVTKAPGYDGTWTVKFAANEV
jgi:hypothetical protein